MLKKIHGALVLLFVACSCDIATVESPAPPFIAPTTRLWIDEDGARAAMPSVVRGVRLFVSGVIVEPEVTGERNGWTYYFAPGVTPEDCVGLVFLEDDGESVSDCCYVGTCDGRETFTFEGENDAA